MSSVNQLSEAWTDEDQRMVHKNPSVQDLKRLARNARYHSARFVIYNDGELVAADSEHYTHHSMAPAMGAWAVRGYVTYMGDNDWAYRSMEVYSPQNKDHPLLRKWEASGIDNGNPSVVEESNNMPVLYHGTIVDNLPSIHSNGLAPRVGSFTGDIYGNKAKPLVFAADADQARAVYCSLAASIYKKIGHMPDLQEFLDNAAVLVIEKDRNKFKKYEGKIRKGSMEPGDYYSAVSVVPDRVLQGENLNNWLKQTGADRGELCELAEAWSKKYKKSIDCNNPKGFSQRAHCAARRKRQKGGKTTSNPLNENNNVEIHNYKKLDRILVALCNLVDTRRKKNPDKYGWVAAGLLDPRNRLVIGFSTFANDKWYHAERLAMRAYRKKYGSIPDGCIIVTTCSPCSEQMPRYGESCTDLINKSPVKKVYCGYSDTTQSQSQRTFNIMVTADTNIRERCQKFAENFMDWEEQYLDESLRDWFKQKWVRFGPDGKIRGDCARGSEGEGKPKCLPQKKAWALGKKKRATAARRKRREDPNPERAGKARNVATKESVSGVKLGDLCTIKTNFPDADFWLVRRTDKKNVGKPVREFSPYHIGIKVTDTEKLDSRYLYYMMTYLFNQGYWAQHSYGMGNLVNIRTDDVKNIALALTEQEMQENKSCPHCGGSIFEQTLISEKKDACYYKVKSRYKVWPSAYASGALVQCRKKGAKNWGKSKTNEAAPWEGQGSLPLPTKLYHVTRTRNRLSIRQRGLVPKTKEHDHILRQPGVFGFETFEQAEDWAYYWSQDEGESMDIWEIDVHDPNELTPDPARDIQTEYDAWVIYKPIPAANVRLKFTQRWPAPWGKPTTTVKKLRNLEEDPDETQ